MSITKAQIAKRKNYIGSSDVPAIFGVDPFKSPYDVYLEKTKKLAPQKETTVMSRGKFMEPALLMFASSILGRINARWPEKIVNPTRIPFLIDHPDAIVVKSGEPIEAKSQSIYSKEQWGDEGTDQIPDRVILQCEFHILCNDTDVCHVPADVAYRGFLMFIVKRDKDIISRILEKCDEFWNKYVKTDTPPPNTLPSPETLRRLIRVPKKTIELPRNYCPKCERLVTADEIISEKFHTCGHNTFLLNDYLVKAKENADTTYAAAKTVKEAADLALKAALGDAEQGNFDGGYISYFQYHRKAETKIREAYDYRSIKVVMDK